MAERPTNSYLCWPKVTIYRAATRRRFAVHPNRYPGVLIGVAVQVGSRVLSIVWRRLA